MPTPSSGPPQGEQTPTSPVFPACPDESLTPSSVERGGSVNHDETGNGQHVALDAEHSQTSHGFQDDAPVDTGALDEDIGRVPSPHATIIPNSSQLSRISRASPNIAGRSVAETNARDHGKDTHYRTSSPRSAKLAEAGSDLVTRSRGNQSSDSDPDDQETDMSVPSNAYDFPSLRTKPPCICPFLRPGSKFQGMQQSEKQKYEVQVEIKHVDPRESLLCGYLRIQGLTEDHPTLTTYFEGEIIGSKYNFFTANEAWGATPKDDLSHWAKFGAFRPFQKQARRGIVHIPDLFQREHIFMRWKEHFLVPDHRVKTITGASFEGFYYICFNQLRGEVSGIYFHSKSEKFQQLELKHVKDRGCFSAVEFR